MYQVTVNVEHLVMSPHYTHVEFYTDPCSQFILDSLEVLFED